MSQPCLPIDSRRLDDEAAKPAVFGTVLEGQPLETNKSLFAGDHGRYKVGVWQCTPGLIAMKDWPFDEFCVLLSGRVVVTPEGGAPREYRAGDALVLPLGFTGTWEITETVRKYYAVQTKQSLLGQVRARVTARVRGWLRPGGGLGDGMMTATKLAVACVTVF